MKRVVVKIGTSTITEKGEISDSRLSAIVGDVASLVNDVVASNRPLTNTITGHPACPNRNGSSCSARVSPVAATVDAYPASTSGAVDV